MKKKLLCFTALSLIAAAALFAQTGNTGQDYWMDETGQFHQIIRWTKTNAPYYDIELERRDEMGRWLGVETRRTEDTYLELVLPPGAYRFRVHTYNVLERLVGSSDWTAIRIYEAKAPAADVLPSVEIIRGETTFTVHVTGEDLVESAEIYLISRKKGSEPIHPLGVEYSYDESWIRAEFSSEAAGRGTYDLVITNPGGLSQTVEGIAFKLVRAAPAAPDDANPFSLDNTRSWSLGAMGYMGFNTDIYFERDEQYEGSSEYVYGGALNYTFFEKYRNYGKFFFLPNSFFAELAFTAKNKYYERNLLSPYGERKEIDQTSLTLETGFLYKIRIGRKQRFIFNFGMGMGLGLNFYDGAHHDYGSLVEPISISGTSVYIHITLRTGLSFRISPAWTADLGVIFGGAGELSNSGDLNERTRPPMEAIFLGVTYRRPYGR